MRKNFSKSIVSQTCKNLDKKVKEFRERPLIGEYPFLSVDTTYFKVRERSRVISKAFMMAYATNNEGYREIIGFNIYEKERKETWNDFLKSLRERGLAGELQEMFNCKTIEEARKYRNAIIADYRVVAEKAMECLEEGFEDAMTVIFLPKYLHKYFRTSNQIQRLNKELKRRSKIIGIFPDNDSLMRIMEAVLMERNEALSSMRRIFHADTYRKLMTRDVSKKLSEIADEQHRILAA